jgi:hypothetical protein
MMRKRILTGVALALALGAAIAPAYAQKTPLPRSGGGGRPDGVQATPQERAELERRFRENFAAAVKKRLQATDEQMTRLIEVNQRLDAQRRQLFQEERTARIGLRTELANPEDRINQQRVAELLETVLRVQRARLEMVEREQRELSAFLTPLQRARYQGFVESVQRRMDDMDGRGGARGRGAGSDGDRGGPPGAAGRSGKRPPPTTPPPASPPAR